MSQLIRNLILVCSPLLLAGCQHTLAPTVGSSARFDNVTQPPAPVVTERVAALDVGVLAKANPQDESLIASAQKQPESQTGQLADGLMLVFKTFTGH
jgi:hypothetical protein